MTLILLNKRHYMGSRPMLKRKFLEEININVSFAVEEENMELKYMLITKYLWIKVAVIQLIMDKPYVLSITYLKRIIPRQNSGKGFSEDYIKTPSRKMIKEC